MSKYTRKNNKKLNGKSRGASIGVTILSILLVLGIVGGFAASLRNNQVEKKFEYVYEDFTMEAEELKQYVGVTSGTIEGGNICNVDINSISLTSFQGEENVLRFTTTNVNGGLYINMTKHLPKGRIIPDQDFVLTFKVYATDTLGYRIGIIKGDECSYKPVWKNPYSDNQVVGWHTVTVTSNELRGADTDELDNITGIYIACTRANYDVYIKDVTMTFGTTESTNDVESGVES